MPDDANIVGHLEHFVQTRAYPKTFCPSEVARALSAAELSSGGFTTWRDAMDSVRQAAEDARSQGTLEVLQRGEVIDPQTAICDLKGPIRLRRAALRSDAIT